MLKARTSWWHVTGAVLVAAIGLWNVYGPTIWSGFRLLQDGRWLTDPMMENYFLEHTFQWAFNPHYPFSLGSPGCFYPLQGDFWRSDNLLGGAPVYWLLRTVFTWDVAMQLWCMVFALCNFAAVTWTLQRLGVRPLLAWVAGYVYAFGLTTAFQLSHPVFLPRCFLVLVFYWTIRFCEQPTARRLMAVTGFLYWQMLVSLYIGFFTTLALVAMLPILLAGRMGPVRDFLGREWKASTAIVLGFGAGMLLLAGPYLHTSENARVWSEVARLTPRLGYWLWPASQSLCWGWYSDRWWTFLGGPSMAIPFENTLFPGAVPWLLFGWATFLLLRHKVEPGRVRIAAACMGVATFLVLLTLMWPNGTTLWWWVWKFLPGASDLRAISRVWMVINPLGMLGALLCIDSWLSRERSGTVVAAAVLLLCLLDQAVVNAPTEDKAQILSDIHGMADIMKTGTLAYVSVSHHEEAGVTHVLAMWGGLEAGVPVINGLTAMVPRGYPNEAASTEQLLHWLGPYQGRLTVIYPPAADPPDALATIFAHDEETVGSVKVCHLQLPLARVFRSGLKAGARLQVANLGNVVWPAEGSYRVTVQIDDANVSLPQDLPPGSEVTLPWPSGVQDAITVKVVQAGVAPDYQTADGVLQTRLPRP